MSTSSALVARAALTVSVFTLAATGPAAAASTSPEATAIRLLSVDHRAFLATKALAPPPFDWSTDGCTRAPAAWARTFDEPCQQHDFGYRNLGRGLRLRATEGARAWVDRRLLVELRRVCAERFARVARTRCRIQARAMYAAVRLFNPQWS